MNLSLYYLNYGKGVLCPDIIYVVHDNLSSMQPLLFLNLNVYRLDFENFFPSDIALVGDLLMLKI
jgi:hypothetical protein